MGFVIAGIVIASMIAFSIALMIYYNHITRMKEKIKTQKSKIRILKAKYLQVLRKVGTTQATSNASHGNAYASANRNGAGVLIGGAIGSITSNFEEASDLVVQLAEEYADAQQELNRLVEAYNAMIAVFPKIILAKILRLKKEEYVDAENIEESTKLQGFDETDI